MYWINISTLRYSTFFYRSTTLVSLAVKLLLLVTFSDHDIDCTCAAVMLLGGMKSKYIVKFRQPLGQVAFKLSNLVGVSFAFAMQYQHGPYAVPNTILNKTVNFTAGFINGHSVQVKTGFNGVLTLPKFSKHPMLNTRPLPTQNIVGRKRLHHIGGQWVGIAPWLIQSRPLALEMTRRQLPRRFDIRAVWSANATDVLHFLQKIEAFIFSGHSGIW